MSSRLHYRFGPFDFDTHSRVLRRDGEIVSLPPQPAQVLHILLEHAGSVVLRSDLKERIWPDTRSRVTPEQGLNAAVARVRDALGERASAPRYVETLPRRGYRFRAPVEAVRERSSGLRPSPVRGARAGAAALLCAGLVALVSWAAREERAPSRTPSVSAGVTPGASGSAERAYRAGRRLMDRASMGGVRAALPYLERAVAEEPSFASARGELALAYYRLGRYEDARTHAEEALDLAPDPRSHVVLARLALERDFDWESAGSLLRRAVTLAPDRYEYQMALAHYEVLAGRTSEGLRRLESILARNLVGPLSVGDVGRLYYWAGDYETALAHCERSLELMSLEVRPRAERCRLDALRELGRWEAAVSSARRLMEHAGAGSGQVEKILGTSAREAIRAFDRWSLREGNRVVALGADSHYRRALVLTDLGRIGPALDALQSAARARDPSFASALVEPRLRPLREEARFEELTGLLTALRENAFASESAGGGVNGVDLESGFAAGRSP